MAIKSICNKRKNTLQVFLNKKKFSTNFGSSYQFFIKSYNSKLRPLVLSVALISCNSCSLLEKSWRQLRTTSCMHSTFLGNPNNCKLCLANDFFGLQTHETWICSTVRGQQQVEKFSVYLTTQRFLFQNTTGFIERVQPNCPIPAANHIQDRKNYPQGLVIVCDWRLQIKTKCNFYSNIDDSNRQRCKCFLSHPTLLEQSPRQRKFCHPCGGCHYS